MYDEGGSAINDGDIEFISLIAGQQSFCLDLNRVREIRRWEPITMLPRSPGYVLGVVNLRGAVIPIVDLAQKLGFAKIEPTKRNVIIISHYGSQVVGFLVESVSEIFAVKSSEVKEAPSLGSTAEHPYIQGVISIEDNMVRIINIDFLMEVNAMEGVC